MDGKEVFAQQGEFLLNQDTGIHEVLIFTLAQ
jgi:hypothetical protein